MESNQEMSGSTKSDTTEYRTSTPGSVSMGTSALKYTCPHVELACYSMSISVPVHPTTYKRLSYQACPSCAISIVGQALENLEYTLPPKSTDKLGSECSVLQTSSEDTTSATQTSEKPSVLLTEDIVQPTKPVWRLLPWIGRSLKQHK